MSFTLEMHRNENLWLKPNKIKCLAKYWMWLLSLAFKWVIKAATLKVFAEKVQFNAHENRNSFLARP